MIMDQGFKPHFYVRAWYGYGDSLLDYDVKTVGLRGGFVLRKQLQAGRPRERR